MMIRKSQSRGWPLRFRHDGRHVGAAALAARRRASIEVLHHEGKHSLLAFIECSKCYERVRMRACMPENVVV